MGADALAVSVPGERVEEHGASRTDQERLLRLIVAQRDLACAPLDQSAVFELLAGAVLSIFDAEGALAAEPLGDEVVARAVVGSAGPVVGDRIPQAGTLAGLTLRSRRPHLCTDAATDPRTDDAIDVRSRTRSSIMAPLLDGDQAIGLIAAMSSRPHGFDEQDLALLNLLGEVAAGRLRAARTHQREQETVARSAAITEVMAEGLVELDGQGRVVHANASAQAMLGFTWDGSVGTSAPESDWTFLHEDGTERAAETLPSTTVLLTGVPVKGQVIGVRNPEGTLWWLLANSVPRLDGSHVCGVVNSFTDITEQTEAAARLAASEEHFRMAFDNAPIGMTMISLAPGMVGHYLRANDSFLEMVGYSRADVVGQRLEELTHPDDLERDRDRFGRLCRNEVESLSFQKRYRHKDGQTVMAWLNTAVARGLRDEPLYLITHAVDISDRLREQAELERLALTDTLTGLANRTLLTDRLDQALARLHRTGGACAMLLLDIDRFKLVNDSLGHLVGDALLVEVAGRISDVTRADTTVARIGGDEFVVLVEAMKDPESVHALATRLLDALRRPYDLGPTAESLFATVSIGVSLATTADRTHVDLYREADLALYRAKDSGRDQYALFDDGLRESTESKLRADSLLRHALAGDRLVAVFQPMVDLQDGAIHAAEGLARVIDEHGQLRPPADFIDVAEDTGLIVEVDARMFELVVAEHARIAADPTIELRRVSTNVSARSLEDPGFVGRVRKALAWYGVPGSAIRVELTERSLLTSSPVVAESLRRLTALGVHVGLDDFGTGYSALAYLQRFSLQFLKIDRSFVSRLGSSERDDAVVCAVIDLAHAHDLIVVGEGVETPEQLAALRAMGCDRAQGYLMGKPMSAAELEALLRTEPRW